MNPKHVLKVKWNLSCVTLLIGIKIHEVGDSFSIKKGSRFPTPVQGQEQWKCCGQMGLVPDIPHHSAWGKRETQHEEKGKLNTRKRETQHEGKMETQHEGKGKVSMREKENSAWGEKETQHEEKGKSTRKKRNSEPGKRETQHSKCSHPKIFPWGRRLCPCTDQPCLQQEKQELGSNKRLRVSKNLSRFHWVRILMAVSKVWQ